MIGIDLEWRKYNELAKVVMLGLICIYLRQLFLFLFESGVHQVNHTCFGPPALPFDYWDYMHESFYLAGNFINILKFYTLGTL